MAVKNKVWVLTLTDEKLLSIGFDIAKRFVIVAHNENTARLLAALGAGDEGDNAWLLPQCSTCEVLDTRSDMPYIVCMDFNNS